MCMCVYVCVCVRAYVYVFVRVCVCAFVSGHLCCLLPASYQLSQTKMRLD